MTTQTMSLEELRELLRETIRHVARYVPRSRRAELLAGLPAVLDDAFDEIAAKRRRSQIDDTSTGETVRQ
jgi:hypothetical protein